MPSDWPRVSLGDHCIKIGSGATPRGGSSVYLDTGEIRLIRSQNIYNDKFNPSGLVYIDDDAANSLSNACVEENDVLLNITGDSVARVCLAEKEFLPARVNQHVAIIRPLPDSFDSRYLRYLLVSPAMQGYLLSLAGGGATRNALTKGMIESLEVVKPPIQTQVQIANKIEALDKKIKINTQLNQTLESIAQAIFKSWFVDFDPVIDNALAAGNPIPESFQARAKRRKQRLYEGQSDLQPMPAELRQLFPDSFVETEELAWVPEGWQVKSIDNLIELMGGGTPKTSREEYWGGEIPWFSVVDAPDISNVFIVDTQKKITDKGLRNSSAKIVRPGTTIISARGTVGKCGIAGVAMAMNQSCYAINGKDGLSDYFIYYLVLLNVGNLQQRGHGSVFNTITRDTFRSISTVSCDTLLSNKYDEIVSSYFDKIKQNLFENSSLEKLRDTLLPKLLSGQVRIPEAEAILDEAVA